MNQKLLNNQLFSFFIAIIAIPVVIMAVLSFFLSDGISLTFSLAGFNEIFSLIRIRELLSISARALIVCTISTTISFFITYFLVFNTSKYFQSFIYTLVTLPFLANESVRVFSWQYLLSANGLINKVLSLITGHQILLCSGSNVVNIYLVMTITCIPFGIFISAASLRTMPSIYLKAANDLNLNTFNKFMKVVVPLSKVALIASLLVTYFISFSLSSEVNYLGGDTKICIRNLVLSLMSASKFQSIFSLGFLITILIIVFVYLFKVKIGLRTHISK